MTDLQREFIDGLVIPAQETEIKYSVLASITIAQAILESGWGKSELALNANNLFGIKGEYDGKSYTVKTKEWIVGQQVEVEAAFRDYPSIGDSIKDHGEFLQKPRYDKVRAAKTYRQAADELQAAGYATAPDYADYLKNLVERYDLDAYDHPIFCPECGARIRRCSTCGYVEHIPDRPEKNE